MAIKNFKDMTPWQKVRDTILILLLGGILVKAFIMAIKNSL